MSTTDSKDEAKAGLHFVIGVDGSDQSYKALETALSVVSDDTRVTIVSITDPRKASYLMAKFKPDQIEETCKVEMISRLPKSQWKVEMVVNNTEKKAYSILQEFVNEVDPDFFFLGSHGRKGPKSDDSVMGQTASFALRSIRAATVITKRNPVPASPKYILVAQDGSETGASAFKAGRALKKTEDVLEIVHVKTPDADERGAAYRPEAVKAAYQAYADEEENIKYVEIEGKTVHSKLLEHSEECEVRPDFLVIGADKMKEFLEGEEIHLSVTDYVSLRSSCHVVVSKIDHSYGQRLNNDEK